MCDKSGHDFTNCLVAIEVECSVRPAGHTDLLCVEPALKHERYFGSCLCCCISEGCAVGKFWLLAKLYFVVVVVVKPLLSRW